MLLASISGAFDGHGSSSSHHTGFFASARGEIALFSQFFPKSASQSIPKDTSGNWNKDGKGKDSETLVFLFVLVG
jgi:hypothetical protein